MSNHNFLEHLKVVFIANSEAGEIIQRVLPIQQLSSKTGTACSSLSHSFHNELH